MVEESSLARLSPTPEYSGALAKEYTLDIPRIPSLELPLRVSSKPQSVRKAVQMCGGLQHVKEALNERRGLEDAQKGLELYLNEGKDAHGSDQFFNEHPIIGKRVPFRDESVILKIQVPQGTMARFGGDVKQALASLNSKEVRVTPVAIVNNTIKFREMSDFQIRLDNVPSAKDFKNSFGSLEWGNFKKYVESVPDNDSRPFENISKMTVNRSEKCPSSDFQLPPPPRFSMVGLPLLYKYTTNPFAKREANGTTEVSSTYIRNYQQFVHDVAEGTSIPVKPHELLQKDFATAQATGVYPGTKKESKFYESLLECVEILKRLFEERSVWVKRHLDGIVPKNIYHTIKVALALVSYRFTTGPWRNTYIRLGVDPRSSPEYAKYQTEYFKIERKMLKSPVASKNIPRPPPPVFESDAPGDIDSRFKFNGRQIPWYFMLQIDLLTDEPNIGEVFDKAQFLPQANELTGWFDELDLAKIRRIVKYELGCMVQGNFAFNKYKLKYYKSMLYVKESMITGQKKDTEGDIDMAELNHDKQSISDTATPNDIEEAEEDEDNGVATGEADEVVLAAEEADEDDNIRVDVPEGDDEVTNNHDDDEDAADADDDEFDPKSATFQEIIERISKIDSETAQRLARDLNGFIYETKM
ncbi:probable Transcription factor tau 95 kDa subunit [Zygosaccharomyces bailii]|nr:probable Transcription factor tau 95 kDa subunit [Zygosaccharomyces bailii]